VRSMRTPKGPQARQRSARPPFPWPGSDSPDTWSDNGGNSQVPPDRKRNPWLSLAVLCVASVILWGALVVLAALAYNLWSVLT